MAHESTPAAHPTDPLHGGLHATADTWELWGEVDYAVVQAAKHRLGTTGGPLRIDASRVTFLDSAGVGLLLIAAGAPAPPTILGCSDYVRDALALAGATDLFLWSTSP
ncbi:STAS domain-containing protein [Cellulosimicrobium funkei]|uniref:STAS domain-containing protein n=1 Tax=Cellulosimicrobium TaxID=157920 RepID=UPI001459A70E|nr:MULTISPECIES: STAS domain-containing protein [Cellulosimicrobium]MCM3535346.1 STAS domain-containing protein [Cellulosimicrobium funkei]NMF29170.1 STAS domain-containing protein [Cellulosimicrobium aquatile]